MQAKDLISSSISPLNINDSGKKAMKLMREYKLYNLPVVKNEKYIGLVSENDILNWDTEDDILNDHISKVNNIYVYKHQHLFDIIEVLNKFSLSVVPVVDKNKKYIGSISNRKLLYTIAKSSAIQSVGSIMVLEMNQNDYSMSEVSRIIESNNAKILSSYVTSHPNSTKIELTLKIDKDDITKIIMSFERFEYKIMASFSKNYKEEEYLQRYESLMRYLNP